MPKINNTPRTNITFNELVQRSRAERHLGSSPLSLLVFDPGETTGFAHFRQGELSNGGQLATKTILEGAPLLLDTICMTMPTRVVMEDYRVYSWKSKQHEWEKLHTPQVIGAVRGLLACPHLYSKMAIIPVIMQMAVTAKQFCTDEKLKQWGFYIKGQPHARDAIRHGCYYLLFGSKHE
jgi:hypothetical protein